MISQQSQKVNLLINNCGQLLIVFDACRNIEIEEETLHAVIFLLNHYQQVLRFYYRFRFSNILPYCSDLQEDVEILIKLGYLAKTESRLAITQSGRKKVNEMLHTIKIDDNQLNSLKSLIRDKVETIIKLGPNILKEVWRVVLGG